MAGMMIAPAGRSVSRASRWMTESGASRGTSTSRRSSLRATPAARWIRRFNELDYLVVVVTNQRGVALGRVRLEDLLEIHRAMVAQLAQAGARVDDLPFCHHGEGTCFCRKPRPGLVQEARRRWDIDLAGSLLVGDSECDRQLAQVCGLRFLRAEAGHIREIVPAPATVG